MNAAVSHLQPAARTVAAAPDIGRIRVDLAAALRWAHRLGLSEGVDNHFSVAVPDEDGVVRGNRFLINPCGWHWSEITASSLVLCDEEGNVLEGGNQVETSAFCIHSRVHVNVPSAVVVLHTHMPYATSLTLLEDPELKMCEQNALMFDGPGGLRRRVRRTRARERRRQPARAQAGQSERADDGESRSAGDRTGRRRRVHRPLLSRTGRNVPGARPLHGRRAPHHSGVRAAQDPRADGRGPAAHCGAALPGAAPHPRPRGAAVPH